MEMWKKEICMEISTGFARETGPVVVYKLKKTLYELKQLPRIWFDKFAWMVIGLGCKQALGDHTLFIKHSGT